MAMQNSLSFKFLLNVLLVFKLVEVIIKTDNIAGGYKS